MSNSVSIQEMPEAVAIADRRERPSLIVILSVGFSCLVAFLAAFGPSLLREDPNAEHLFQTLLRPDPLFWLGTDNLGRDVFGRLIAGTRTALIGPVVIALGSMLISSSLGLVAGYNGGWIDSLVMRVVDLVYALPSQLAAIVVVGVTGGGYVPAVALLTILFSPSGIRLIRGATLEQRSLPYVEAARLLGLSPIRIAFRHIWPNLLPLIVANSFLQFAYALVSLAALSFLGLGVPPGAPDWGRMLAEGRTYILGNPLTSLSPGIMIIATATSMNVIGDWLFGRFEERGRAR